MYNATPKVTASSLLKPVSSSLVTTIIEGLSRDIDAAIINANNLGFIRIEHDLPMTFTGINNMSVKDARTLIYSEILTKYTTPEDEGGRGFLPENVRLRETNGNVKLCISWVGGMSEGEREARNRVIAAYSAGRANNKRLVKRSGGY